MTGSMRAAMLGMLAVVLGAAGCAPPNLLATAGLNAVQAGTAAFVDGELEVADRVPLAAAYAAAHDALTQLDFEIEKETLHAKVGYLTARESGGRRIKIELERKSATVTKFRIRVGWFGDQAISRLVLFQMQQQMANEWGKPAVPANREH